MKLSKELQELHDRFHNEMEKLADKFPDLALIVVAYHVDDGLNFSTFGGNGCYLCALNDLYNFIEKNNIEHRAPKNRNYSDKIH